MKRFSLNKKRASKVLALTLVAAMAVPTLSSAQKSDMVLSGRAGVTVPEPIATLDFADSDSYTMEKTIVKQLIFEKGTETAVWPMVTATGKPVTNGGSSNFHFTLNKHPKRKTAANATTVALSWNATGSAAMGKVTGAAATTLAAVIGSTNPEDYEWEEIDLTPEVVQVTGDVVSGAAVSLKKGVDVKQEYPVKGQYANISDKNIAKWKLGDYTLPLDQQIQKKATYGGGAKIENPFVAKREKLYDADRYTMDNIANTASEVVKSTDAAVLGGPEGFLGDKAAAFTAPEVKAGVTISFWGKVPLDPETKAPKDTSFVEFYNNESLVYQTDDMAKVWAANLYEKNKDKLEELSNTPGSLFYKGEVATGRVVYVGANEAYVNNDGSKKGISYQARTGQQPPTGADWNNRFTDYNDTNATNVGAMTIKPTASAVIAYVKNNGPLMYFNGNLAEEYADYDTKVSGVSLTRETQKGHAQKVLIEYGTVTLKEFDENHKGGQGRNGILITTGQKNEKGEELFTMLRESTDIWTDFYSDGELDPDKKQGPKSYEEANIQYGNFKPGDAPSIEGADASKMGKQSRAGKGVTGYLSLATNAGDFNRDYGTTGKGVNKNHNEAGLLKTFQASNQAKMEYTDVVEDDEWHYFTYTITDEWIQMYIDGEACDPEGAVIGNQFNMGSGAFAPDGTAYRNEKNIGDIFRLYSYDKTISDYGWAKCAWGYGYAFGDTVMQFLTDPNTKLYIGGKTQVTAEGAMVANLSFYDESLSAEQVEAAYLLATGKEVPDVGEDVLLGDVNNDKKIDSNDALEILKEDVGIAHSGTFIKEVANVNKDTTDDGEAKVDSNDALDILKHDVGITLIPEEYVKVVLEDAPAE